MSAIGAIRVARAHATFGGRGRALLPEPVPAHCRSVPVRGGLQGAPSVELEYRQTIEFVAFAAVLRSPSVQTPTTPMPLGSG